jgi:hypothetical protein
LAFNNEEAEEKRKANALRDSVLECGDSPPLSEERRINVEAEAVLAAISTFPSPSESGGKTPHSRTLSRFDRAPSRSLAEILGWRGSV